MATLTPRQIAGLAKLNGWTGDDLSIGVALALAESGGSTTITNRNNNGTIDTGLWQINSVHGVSVEDLKNPVRNAQMAGQIRASQGWTAWSAYDNGRYKPFLNTARAAAANPDDEWARAQAAFGPGGISGPLGAGFPELPDVPVIDEVFEAIAVLGGYLKDAVEVLVAAGKWIADPDNWVRIGLVGLGGAGMIVGLRIVAEPVITPLEQKITGVAKTVATKGASK